MVTKSSHIYACIGIYRSKEDYHGLALCLSGTLDCRLFQSVLFTDFDSLPLHFSNLHELRRLSLVLGPEERLIPEEALFSKALANTVTTRDFTDLIVRLKSGSLDLSRAKWQEIRSTIVNYRYDDFQYVLNRAEDTICSILNEFSSDLLKDSQKLLPESLEQIKDLDVIDPVSYTHLDVYKRQVKYIHMRPHRKGLEHHSQPPLLGRHIQNPGFDRHRSAAEMDFPF